jgi:branched-chain amino acid transport system ATP-binding protein
MGQPEVILLDEPSMGLSPKMVDLIFERIAGIAATGPAVLTVEQNLAVLDISSYAYVLQHGHLVFEGDARVVADDPRVVEAYVGAGPDTVVIPSDKQEPR